MTSKISALAAATAAAETDQHEVNQGGVSKRMTNTQILALRGLYARYHISAHLTYTASTNTIINFNTSDYDPLSAVTTGAAWVFTAPATGWYDVRIVELYVDPNGFTWADGDDLTITIRKNGSYAADLAFWQAGASQSTNMYPFFSCSRGISLTASNTVALRFSNFSGQSRQILTPAAIEIYRVA